MREKLYRETDTPLSSSWPSSLSRSVPTSHVRIPPCSRTHTRIRLCAVDVVVVGAIRDSTREVSDSSSRAPP